MKSQVYHLHLSVFNFDTFRFQSHFVYLNLGDTHWHKFSPFSF